MVATLVRLRLLILRNTLRRQTAQLVMVVIGALYGLFVLVAVVIGMFLLDLAPFAVARTVVVLVGAAAVLGWTVLPLVATGNDETLEPARLAAYPIPLGQLMTGLFLGGVLGVPGTVTMIGALATAAAWSRLPGVAVIAFVCGALGAATCIVASRAAAAVSTGLASGRRFREARAILVLVPLVLAGPIILGAEHALEGLGGSLAVVAGVVSWTPLGAVWAVPSSVALGDPVGALLRFLIAGATLAVLVVLWRWGLARALVTTASSGAVRGGHVRRSGPLGLVRRGAAAAVAARSLTYWYRDPRYQRQLLLIPLLPVLLGFYGALNHSNGFVLALGPVTAFLLASTIATDVSYDGTAFTLHVTTGVAGAADRAGRAAALLVFALPVVVVYTIGSTAYAAALDSAPAVLGLALGVLGSGVGVASISSAILVMPVPGPGDSPFRARPGANLGNALQMLVAWVVLGGLCLPEIALLVAASLTGSAVLGWIALAAGGVLGAVLLVVGVRQGGRLLDRRAPELLGQLQRAR